VSGAITTSSLLINACSMFGDRSGTEQPRYTVVDNLGGSVEVREYQPRLAAEVLVAGGEDETRSAGFRKLAAFIFGDNRANQSIAMTAPVSQSNAKRIAMTAPVAQTEAAPGQWRVRFFMPDAYTIETLPKPTDPDIAVVEVPSETFAAIRFSGSRSPEAVRQETATLLAVVKNSEWRIAGGPEALFYDPPWTLWFLRRNEVAVRVEPRNLQPPR